MAGTIRQKNLPAAAAPTAGDVMSLDGATMRGITIENLCATLGVHAADAVAAATLNLDAVIGDLVDVTGNTGITAITLTNGDCRTVRFTGTPILTNGASLVLPGGANIQVAAGDYAIFRGYASSVVRCVGYFPRGLLFNSSGIGYGAGVGLGGAVTQLTSRTTGVTLNTLSGAITLFAAIAVVGTWISFTVTNSAVAANDVIILSVRSNTNTYVALVSAVNAGAFQISFESIVGTTSDSPVINYTVIKGAAS